jgi:hypothetical protein
MLPQRAKPRALTLTDVRHQTYGFQGQVVQEAVLLGSIVGDVCGCAIILLCRRLLHGHLGAQLALEGGVAGQIGQERGEDKAGDVDVGEEDLSEGLQELYRHQGLPCVSHFVVVVLEGNIPRCRSSRGPDRRLGRCVRRGRRGSATVYLQSGISSRRITKVEKLLALHLPHGPSGPRRD